MKRLAHIIATNAVRVSFFLVIAFTVGIVAMTARFVLLEQVPAASGNGAKRSNVVDRERFEQVTAALQVKIGASVDVDRAIRDPFSAPVLPAPLPPPAPEGEVPAAGAEGEDPAPAPAE